MQFLQNTAQIFYMQNHKFFLTNPCDIYIILIYFHDCIQEYKSVTVLHTAKQRKTARPISHIFPSYPKKEFTYDRKKPRQQFA